ncbi:hypothetical protein E6Q11_04595 [Candidatus Dojkabacteria bacterium]|uniref:Uncharacterized protein n=1 Tax=Candidatus Dojkabacteria bacterium TaxID=2099670 RepID=A0A5C7J4R2_9BACT|nr:MAG: hypothetical protein E6Q11_04595 [Candidatus Dojkabacteria bacterium]
MNKSNLNKEVSRESVRAYYEDHKEYLYPSLAIVASFFLFLFVLLPQILLFPKTRSEVNTEEKKLDSFVAAQNFASSVNSANLNNDLLLSTKALPTEKDYTSMINAVSSAADDSGTVIESYRFLIGGGTLSKTALASGSIPVVILRVNVNGTNEQVVNFMKSLYQTTPVSEISSVAYSVGSAQLTINFFYKPLPSADINSSELIRDKNSEEKGTFENISSWKTPAEGISDIKIVPATDSADLDVGSPF